MNTYPYDRLDAILALASVEYMKDAKKEFLTTTMNVQASPEVRRKVMRKIRTEEHQPIRQKFFRGIRIALVACLILASLALAACMAIPTIREAIWRVVLEWNDDYVAIQFVPSDDPKYTNHTNALHTTTKAPETTTPEPENEPDKPIVTPPTSIEEVNVPSYMPAGYTTKSSLIDKFYTLNYYDANNALLIVYRQATIGSAPKGDADTGIATEISINGLDAILISYTNEENVYNLYWQDNQYSYNIYGYFENYNELIRLATSVTVK
jgi:hypothetical protein